MTSPSLEMFTRRAADVIAAARVFAAWHESGWILVDTVARDLCPMETPSGMCGEVVAVVLRLEDSTDAGGDLVIYDDGSHRAVLDIGVSCPHAATLRGLYTSALARLEEVAS